MEDLRLRGCPPESRSRAPGRPAAAQTPPENRPSVHGKGLVVFGVSRQQSGAPPELRYLPVMYRAGRPVATAPYEVKGPSASSIECRGPLTSNLKPRFVRDNRVL